MHHTLACESFTIGRSKLESKAKHVHSFGETVEVPQKRCKLHYKKLDETREGDTLILQCASRWAMKGTIGSIWRSSGDRIKVKRHIQDHEFAVSCLVSGNFGRIQLIDYLL